MGPRYRPCGICGATGSSMASGCARSAPSMVWRIASTSRPTAPPSVRVPSSASCKRRDGRRASPPMLNPVDKEIQLYVEGTYGKGRWRYDLPPHAWERGGGDAELDRLFADQDTALADLKRTTEAMFAARDEASAAGQGTISVGERGEIALAKARAQAIKDFEKADERASLARARVTTRALWLQERYRRQQAAKGL